MHAPAGRRRGERPGRQPRDGAAFRLTDPATHPAPVQESAGRHDRFGKVLARCWGQLHPKLKRRGDWADHEGGIPIVEGTLVHLAVEYLPGNRAPRPLWLWQHSDPDTAVHDADRPWRIFLSRHRILRRLAAAGAAYLPLSPTIRRPHGLRPRAARPRRPRLPGRRDSSSHAWRGLSTRSLSTRSQLPY